MAATWTIATLERNTADDGVVVAHWRASDVDGDHSGSSYGTGYHRHVVVAGQDYSNESAEVQAICAAVHTDAVIAAYNASLEE